MKRSGINQVIKDMEQLIKEHKFNLYHDFFVPATGGSVLLGEVSMCNDDENDNRFADAEIEEDELPYRLLCNEYPI